MIPKLRLLFLLCLIAILTNACKKDSDEPASYIKFKKDGEWFTYTYDADGWYDTNNISSSVTLRATSSDSTNFISIYITNNSSANLIGTFNSDSQNSYVSLMFYNDPSRVLYFIQDFSGMPPSKYSVTITSITNSFIEGHFVGNYLSNDPIVGGFLKTNITEGKFKLKRIK